MSLITCCPACQTMFQVSGEDLRVSDGWVRCGKCNGVFDASAHLQVMPPVQEESAPPRAPREAEAARAQSIASIPTTAAAAQSQAPALRQGAFPAAERPSLFRAATRGDGMASESAFTGVDVHVAADRAEPPATLRREDRSDRPSFPEPFRFTEHHTPVRSRWRFVFWLLILVVLGVALLGWARHERQALVQRLPALLPAFDGLCGISACTLTAPRRLEVVAVEDASLQEAAPSEYKIQLLLKNVGEEAVDLPALKVTVTGSQGEVLAAHDALPSQFAPGVTRLAPGAPLSVAFIFAAAASAPAIPAPTLGEVASASSSAAPADVVTPSALTASAPVGTAEALAAPAMVPVSRFRVNAFYP